MNCSSLYVRGGGELGTRRRHLRLTMRVCTPALVQVWTTHDDTFTNETVLARKLQAIRNRASTMNTPQALDLLRRRGLSDRLVLCSRRR